jgi:DNA mismatch repair protein MutS
MVLRGSRELGGSAEASDQAVQPGDPSPDGSTVFPSLLFRDAHGARSSSDDGTDRSFARDLNLDQVVAGIAGDREDRGLIADVLFARLRDGATVRYRQQVFRDLEDADLLDAVLRFTALMTEVRAHLRQLAAMRDRYQQEGWLLDAASVYCEAVRSLAGHLASARLGSHALQAFRDYLAAYASSSRFIGLADETRDCGSALGRVRYCLRIRGPRVDVSRYQGEADYSDAVLRTFERFQQDAPGDYLIRYRTRPGMNHVTAQIAERVARLFPEEFTALADYSRRHAAFLEEGIRQADQELRFYLAYLDYTKPLGQAGLRFCYPEVSSTAKEVSAAGIFDLALARKLVADRKPVVTNDFHLVGRERILVVTGPNQGGKTTFARTFGQLHHLASVGCPVPGSAARLFLPDRIFTHFEREEDLARMSGKLEDDLVRIGEILRTATSGSIIILNETFASTTLHDAQFLGTRLLTKVIRLDALCVYVTFVDELASHGEQVVSMMSTVVPEHPAERTFKLVRKPADGLAFALAIAEKYDLTYDRLRERLTGEGRTR